MLPPIPTMIMTILVKQISRQLLTPILTMQMLIVIVLVIIMSVHAHVDKNTFSDLGTIYFFINSSY